MPLSPAALERYARHLTLPGVGIAGQERLLAARVLVVGAGGLGSPVLLYLAAAGVGHLTVVDDDVVALSNLQRQVIHDAGALGTAKVQSATDRIARLNPDVRVRALARRVSAADATRLIEGHDLVVDGTDNFPTRYALSDACAAAGVPYVYGSVQGFEGQVAVLCGGRAPCYRCVFPEAPPAGSVPSCGESGVFGVLPGLVGTMQATEALKLITGVGRTLAGRLLVVDALRMRFHEVELVRDPACTACGDGAARATGEPRAAAHEHRTDEPGEGGNDPMTDPTSTPHRDILPAELAARLTAGERPVIVDVREPMEWRIAHLAGSRHVPLARLPEEAPALDPDAETVVLCHHGVRSAAAAEWLRRSGFRDVRNLVGGIDRWSTDVDPAVARY